MKVKIKVTNKHIKDGIPCNAHLCPIGRAFRDAGYDSVSIVGNGLYDNHCGKNKHIKWNIKLPSTALSFIHDFDHNKEVKPFIFEATLC